MKINVIFSNVTVYNVTRLDVRLGETFKVLLEDVNYSPSWFADNDPSLRIEVEADGKSAVIKTQAIGKTQIQFQNNRAIQSSLDIEVFDKDVVDLGLKAGSPERK